jgi:hypothetical protein
MKPFSNNLESDEHKVIMFMPPVVAHEAYTWDELAAAIRQAYKDITQVYVLPKLINWSESIHPYVNDASKTPGLTFQLSAPPMLALLSILSNVLFITLLFARI